MHLFLPRKCGRSLLAQTFCNQYRLVMCRTTYFQQRQKNLSVLTRLYCIYLFWYYRFYYKITLYLIRNIYNKSNCVWVCVFFFLLLSYKRCCADADDVRLILFLKYDIENNIYGLSIWCVTKNLDRMNEFGWRNCVKIFSFFLLL